MRLPIPDAIPLPKELPLPDLSPAQWVVVGGAVVAAVVDVISPPIALAVAAVPLIDRYLLSEDGGRRQPARRTRSARATGKRRRTTARA
ncbi:MAG TPA: hypothetical protein VGQ42_00420 [Candidatus Dormibacteraeota bacterium]|jgi:hypothetical protein|nr:hypothetical protein [Candidatus Dormibacteraeota bacterium]